MWSYDQRRRLYLENEVLHQEEFTQFTVYRYQASDTYEASGTTSSSSGKLYTLAIPIPSGFPQAAPAHVPHLSVSAVCGGRKPRFFARGLRTTCTRLGAVIVRASSDLPLARRPMALGHCFTRFF